MTDATDVAILREAIATLRDSGLSVQLRADLALVIEGGALVIPLAIWSDGARLVAELARLKQQLRGGQRRLQ